MFDVVSFKRLRVSGGVRARGARHAAHGPADVRAAAVPHPPEEHGRGGRAGPAVRHVPARQGGLRVALRAARAAHAAAARRRRAPQLQVSIRNTSSK